MGLDCVGWMLDRCVLWWVSKQCEGFFRTLSPWSSISRRWGFESEKGPDASFSEIALQIAMEDNGGLGTSTSPLSRLLSPYGVRRYHRANTASVSFLASTSIHMSFQASRLGSVYLTTAVLRPVKSLHGALWRMTIIYPSECSVFLLCGGPPETRLAVCSWCFSLWGTIGKSWKGDHQGLCRVLFVKI